MKKGDLERGPQGPDTGGRKQEGPVRGSVQPAGKRWWGLSRWMSVKVAQRSILKIEYRSLQRASVVGFFFLVFFFGVCFLARHLRPPPFNFKCELSSLAPQAR